MIFSEFIFLRAAILILGIGGFMVAKYIRKHKKTGSLLICPIKFDCNTVVNSDYSKFFGVPVEILGMAYYGLVIISYLLSLIYFYFLPGLPSNILIVSMITLSAIAFFFSIYLIGVQVFILKKGCSWCLVSAAISISIFILTVLAYNLNSIALNIIQ